MTLRLVNPATEESVAELEQAGVPETDRAVAAAKAAFPAWRAVAPSDRGALLRRLAGPVEEAPGGPWAPPDRAARLRGLAASVEEPLEDPALPEPRTLAKPLAAVPGLEQRE